MKLAPRSTLIAALVSVLLASSVSAQGSRKLYRWTDDKGEVHYTDQLPPEAAEAAREELNKSGMAINRVDRALTAEERVVFEKEQARLAEEKRVVEEQAKMDSVLVASYPREDDLARAYRERFELLEQSLESARVGIRSQEKSLTEMLAHAADLERNGRAVDRAVIDSIGRTRQQVVEQRAFLGKREAEKANLQKEYDSMLARYRRLTSKPNEEGATPDSDG
jgi:hypothetical protein